MSSLSFHCAIIISFLSLDEIRKLTHFLNCPGDIVKDSIAKKNQKEHQFY